MLKAGVLGAGHLGKIHLKLLQQSSKYDLIGFYDPIKENALKVSEEFGYKVFDSIEEMINAVDVVDIVTPTLNHYNCAKTAIEKGKHVFIEKPITKTVVEAEEIRDLVKLHKVRGQVGMLNALILPLPLLKIKLITQCLLNVIVWLNLILEVLMFR